MAAVSAQKKRLDDIEKDAERIKRDYDQYFLGLSKRPPTTAQAQFAGMMRKIKEDELREWGTQDRFRFNQIQARFVSLERVWAREMKQIEDGTHKRDKLKLSLAKKKEAAALGTMSGEGVAVARSSGNGDPVDSIDVDMDQFNEDSLPGVSGLAPPAGANGNGAPKPAPPKPAPRPTQPAATASKPGGDLGGLSEQRLQQLYKVYMDAKKRTGEASNLSFEALRTQIAKQVPQIRQKHNCEQVDFKVVLKDGKAMLKAIPK